MRSPGHRARTAGAALILLLLAACARNDSAGCVLPPSVSPPPIVIPTLVSPAPGATGVSTGPLDVTIGNAGSAVLLYLNDPVRNFIGSTNFRQADPTSTAVRIGTFPQLSSQTTYQVYANVLIPNGNGNPCGPNPALSVAIPELLGSFTTR